MKRGTEMAGSDFDLDVLLRRMQRACDQHSQTVILDQQSLFQRVGRVIASTYSKPQMLDVVHSHCVKEAQGRCTPMQIKSVAIAVWYSSTLLKRPRVNYKSVLLELEALVAKDDASFDITNLLETTLLHVLAVMSVERFLHATHNFFVSMAPFGLRHVSPISQFANSTLRNIQALLSSQAGHGWIEIHEPLQLAGLLCFSLQLMALQRNSDSACCGRIKRVLPGHQPCYAPCSILVFHGCLHALLLLLISARNWTFVGFAAK